jgi:L-tartrate/succinate antiporter
VTWVGWFLGFLPIGFVLFILQPLLIYRIYPPTVRVSADVPKWAHRELVRLGPLTRRETMMALLALLALSLWIFGGRWMTATAVALLTLCLMVLSGVIAWDDFLGYRRAWSNLIWFATLITLANGLSRVGFLPWFAATASGALGNLPGTATVALLVVVFFVSHYLFASLTAHATAMLPVFLTAVMALPGLPVPLVSVLLSYSLAMGTTRATGSAALLRKGYISHRSSDAGPPSAPCICNLLGIGSLPGFSIAHWPEPAMPPARRLPHRQKGPPGCTRNTSQAPERRR